MTQTVTAVTAGFKFQTIVQISHKSKHFLDQFCLFLTENQALDYSMVWDQATFQRDMSGLQHVSAHFG
jgi:hypothetical protein